MRGPKTNEGATRVDERVGTRAQVRYVRASATKAREVLDLIRGRHVGDADDILRFVERDIAIVIRKALASAVANAQHNDSQDPDELHVAACFADDGPTLKRFRPRARGRATRVRKRTCHITIVVARMSDDQLELRRRREERHPQTGRRARVGGRAATSRRERVARSRQAAAAARGEVAHDHEHDHDHEEEAESAASDSAVRRRDDEEPIAERQRAGAGGSEADTGDEDFEELEAVEDADEIIDAEIEGAELDDDDVAGGEPTEEMVEEAEEVDGIEPESADEADAGDEDADDDAAASGSAVRGRAAEEPIVRAERAGAGGSEADAGDEDADETKES